MKRRNTQQKQMVYDSVVKLDHPTVEEICCYLQQSNVSQSTVYRNLTVLMDEGRIFKIPIDGFADRYDFTQSRHYHVTCRHCGKAHDIDVAYQSALDQLAKGLDASISGHTVLFYGACDCCKDNSEHILTDII